MFVRGLAVKREDLAIERRVQEDWRGRSWGFDLGVPIAGTFNCHIVLDKLEQRAYAIKYFYKNADGAQRAFRWMFALLCSFINYMNI